MNLETKITIYKFTPQLFTLTRIYYLLVCMVGSTVLRAKEILIYITIQLGMLVETLL